MKIILVFLSLFVVAYSSVPRNVIIKDEDFIVRSTGEKIVLSGPNVVVKAHPYLPGTDGESVCNDVVNDECTASGTCTTCYTFTQADIDHIKSQGFNSIRLGVAWTGAQPAKENESQLDADFVERLHKILDLTDKNDLHVILDNHGDMVTSLGCGNGVPVWIAQEAASDLIGKPLETAFPFSLVSSLNVEKVAGYDHCGNNETMWNQHAGDINYNLLNECCLAMNSPNPGGLGYTKIAQKTMNYILKEGSPGKRSFINYWRLIAKEVVNHPSAIALELMNEPMTIQRREAYDTWKDIAIAVLEVIPDISVSIQDTGEGAVFPAWITEHGLTKGGIAISKDTLEYIKASSNLFYAWHWYGQPTDANDAVKNAQALGKEWNVPTFLTEVMSCEGWNAAKDNDISHSYWHYSSYCDTGPSFGNKNVPSDTFGGCILGWAAGTSDYTC